MSHIKMPDIRPIVRYTADGVQTDYAYPFPIFASEDLVVSLDGAQQVSGFTISGAGVTEGGLVRFDAPPAAGQIVGLKRELPLERLSDYIEGGDFSASSINSELDYLVAAVQQVNRVNETMLRYDEAEAPGAVSLPQRALRAGKALGFDGNGDPVAVSLEGSMAQPSFTATGTGAATRTSADKLSDLPSVKDFGAVGDGVSDDTSAIQNALAAYDAVLLPRGVYLISSTIRLNEGQALYGLGDESVIAAQSNSFTAVHLAQGFARLEGLRITGGSIGAALYAVGAPCVQNVVRDVRITGADIGVQLDGYQDTAAPCYWNYFNNVLVDQPAVHGVHLTLSGAGDTPNANTFHGVRVYSHGSSMSGSGIYVEHGAYNNAFVDCEANVSSAAHSCVRVGADASQSLFVNLFTESANLVPNLRLESGSSETAIYNLLAASNGAAIDDESGGAYIAVNAGYPYKNTLGRTQISDAYVGLLRRDSEFIDTAGSHVLDLSHTLHIVNAINGAIDMELPAASDANGAEITIKKSDPTGNLITITESGSGAGADGKTVQLGGPNDYVTMVSNGASWFITASNRMAGNDRYYDGTGTYDIDMAVDLYLLSSYSGALIARLPPADAPEAIGRRITLKKVDPSGNTVTVTEQGGAGPDQAAQVLSARYQHVSVMSNGAEWYVV